MNRRMFLKAAAVGVATVFMAKANLVLARDDDYEDDFFAPFDRSPPLSPDYFVHSTLASNSKKEVGLRLVCLFDASGSIDSVEYDYQLRAMAKAIASEDFRNAVFYIGGPQSIAISVADFSDSASLQIPWVDIRKGDDYKFTKLADEIMEIDRRTWSGTDHVVALNQAMACLDSCPWEGKKNVIDILTDGEHYGWQDLDEARTKATKEYEATINALITLDEYNLDKWAQENLVTRPGFFKKDGTPLDPGFVKVVATQQSSQSPGALVEYHEAMELAFRRKLILEVAGLDLEDLREIVASETKNPIMPSMGVKPRP